MDPILEALQRQYDAQRGVSETPALRSSLPAAPIDDPLLAEFQRQYDAQRQNVPTEAPKSSTVSVKPETNLPLGPEMTTFLRNGLNTAFFNVPRNISAGLDYVTGQAPSFGEAYDRRKAMDEALDRQNPKSATAGTATGIIGPVAATFMTGGAAAPALAPATAKMVGGVARKPGLLSTTGEYAATVGKGALYGAAGGAASEFMDSKDLRNTIGAGAIGGVVGGVAAPAFKAVGSGVARMSGKRGETYPGMNADKLQESLDGLKKLPPGSVSPEAIQSMERVIAGMTATAHPDVTAIANLMRGLSKDDTIKFLGGMTGFGLGGLSGPLGAAGGAAGGYAATKALNGLADILERRSKDFYSKDWSLPYQVTQRPALRAGLLAGGWAGDESR